MGKEKLGNYIIDTFFTFKGRMARLEYFISRLVLFGVFVLCLLPVFLFDEPGRGAKDILENIGIIIYGIFIFGMLIASAVASVALYVKRWHDLNISGWLTILNLIPYIGFIPDVYLLFAKGTHGENMYGEDPLKRNTLL